MCWNTYQIDDPRDMLQEPDFDYDVSMNLHSFSQSYGIDKMIYYNVDLKRLHRVAFFLGYQGYLLGSYFFPSKS